MASVALAAPQQLGAVGSDAAERKPALFLIQTQVNPGSGRVIPLGNLSTVMHEALKVADAYLRAHIKDLGVDRDPRQYDFTVQAVNLNQAKEGAKTAVAFFISLVSALLEHRPDPTTVVVGEMSIRGLLQKVASLPERLQPVFYTDPIHAAIRAMRLE